MSSFQILTLIGSVFCVSFVLTYSYKRFALATNTLAAINERSAHKIAIPTGSGIVLVFIFAALLLALYLQSYLGVKEILALVGPILVGIVGYIDDRRELSVKLRLGLYLIAAFWSVYWLGFPALIIENWQIELGVMGLFFGALSVFWLQNLFNFMDGIDGFAAAEVLFVCCSVIILTWGTENGWQMLNLCIVALAAGYLCFNWPKAGVFMGDAGSSFFGLLLALFVISNELTSVWVWIILLGQFLVDACLTIVVRLLRADKIYQSHSQTQILYRQKFGPVVPTHH